MIQSAPLSSGDDDRRLSVGDGLACGQKNGFLDEVAHAPMHKDFFEFGPPMGSRCDV